MYLYFYQEEHQTLNDLPVSSTHVPCVNVPHFGRNLLPFGFDEAVPPVSVCQICADFLKNRLNAPLH